MSQQLPVVNGKPYQGNENRIRRLFIQTGAGFEEIANSRGKRTDEVGAVHEIARIVEVYTPPSPTTKAVEIKVSNGPSILHGGGRESYKISLRLIFPNKLLYNDFIFLLGNEMKFYDEKGAIFQCVLVNSPDVSRVEAGKRYDVTIQLVGVRKAVDEEDLSVKYVDLVDGTVQEITINSPTTQRGYVEFRFTGLNTTTSIKIASGRTEEQVRNIIYNDFMMYGLDLYYTITPIEDNKIQLAAKHDEYNFVVELIENSTGSDIVLAIVEGAHWAKDHIENCARLGFVAQYDNNGNYVYTYNPNVFTTRAQFALVLNRLRKYFERVIV